MNNRDTLTVYGDEQEHLSLVCKSARGDDFVIQSNHYEYDDEPEIAVYLHNVVGSFRVIDEYGNCVFTYPGRT